jgi:hypothetical protein
MGRYRSLARDREVDGTENLTSCGFDVLVLFMTDATPTAERREQMLGLLAEKTLALACAVQQRALEAETSQEMAQLSQAFVRLSRSVRQSIALHARHERDRVHGDREASEAVAQARAPAVERRKARLQRDVMDILGADWDPDIEEDDGESYELGIALRERLDDLSETEDFLDVDPDQLIARLCEDLAVEAARADAALAPHKAAAAIASPGPGSAPRGKPNGHDTQPSGHDLRPPAPNSS